MSPDVTLTSVETARDPIPIEAWGERQEYCNATYEFVKTIASEHGYKVHYQTISHELRDIIATGVIGFAKESRSSWVEWFFRPLVVDRLISQALPSAWHSYLEWPSYSGEGGKDTDLSPEENAIQIIGFMEALAKEAPSAQNFTEFLRNARHPNMSREAEVFSLVAESKMDEAKMLCAGILKGEVGYSSLYRVLPTEEGVISPDSKIGIYWRGCNNGPPPDDAVTFIHVIKDWLDQQPRPN